MLVFPALHTTVIQFCHSTNNHGLILHQSINDIIYIMGRSNVHKSWCNAYDNLMLPRWILDMDRRQINVHVYVHTP